MEKILIVMEDSKGRTDLQKLFSLTGYYTALVDTADEMLLFCRQHTPDMIFLDVDNSGKDIWPFVHAVRALRDLANLAILGVASVGSGETLKQAREFGFCGLMPRNTDPETMLNAIESIMIETKQNQYSATPTGLARLIELSEEVTTVASCLKDNIAEFGTEGAELYVYIENSSHEISQKLSRISEPDLADKELRHDFRNLIGSVTGFSELLLMEPSLSPTSQKRFTRLRQCSKEFVDILDQQKALASNH